MKQLILLSVFLFYQVSCDCEVDSSVTDAKDVEMVKTAIKMLEPIKSISYKVPADDGANYQLAICSDALPVVPNATVLYVTDKERIAMGFYNRTLAIIGYNYVEFTFLTNMSYPNTTKRDECKGKLYSTRLTITCEEDTLTLAPAVSRTVGSDCSVQLQGEHKLACLHPHPHGSQGLGGFSIFLIIVFVGLIAYFVIGCGYMRFVKGAKGVDQVPNKEFWFRFGNAFADCTNSLCRCDRYADPYNVVDDPMPASTSSHYQDSYQQIPHNSPPMHHQPDSSPDANLIQP